MDTIEQVIGILDSEDENKRLELVLESTDTPRLALRMAIYSEGLGWYTQKTIHLEAKQAEELQFLLGGARYLLKQAEQGGERTKSVASESSATNVRQFATTRKSA